MENITTKATRCMKQPSASSLIAESAAAGSALGTPLRNAAVGRSLAKLDWTELLGVYEIAKCGVESVRGCFAQPRVTLLVESLLEELCRPLELIVEAAVVEARTRSASGLLEAEWKAQIVLDWLLTGDELKELVAEAGRILAESGTGASVADRIASPSPVSMDEATDDTIFNLIERHKVLVAEAEKVDTGDGDNVAWIAAVDFAAAAMEELVHTEPTTLAGAAALAWYVSTHPARRGDHATDTCLVDTLARALKGLAR